MDKYDLNALVHCDTYLEVLSSDNGSVSFNRIQKGMYAFILTFDFRRSPLLMAIIPKHVDILDTFCLCVNPFTAATRNSRCIKLQLIVHHQNNSNRLLKMHFYWNCM